MVCRKIILLLAAVLALATVNESKGQAALIALIFGDQVASEKFNLSLEFGVNQPWITEIDNTDRSALGINFGIGANIKLSENWFLCPNAYFLSSRGIRINSFSPTTGNPSIDESFSNSETEIMLRYIDVPVFLHYQTDNEKFRFGLAPQVSFLTQANANFSATDGDFSQNIEDELNSLDYGIIGNFTYVLGKAHKGRGVHLHLRYYYGFGDVFKDDYISGDNRTQFISAHISLPFITDELAAKNLEQN